MADTRPLVVYVVDDEALAAPLPQPRVDALEAVVRESGADTGHRAVDVSAAQFVP